MSYHFSPLRLIDSLIKPLRYFFENYAGDDLKYNTDASETKIEIDTVNSFHKVTIETQPRILVDRGPYTIAGRHLNEDLAESDSPHLTFGLEKRKNHSFIQGQLSITIEARTEGSCEVITDMVASFLNMTSHLIAREYGFKSIARPVNVGSCAPFEDGEKNTSFRTVIVIPYEVEENYQIREDGIKIKDINFNVQRNNN